MTRNSPKAADFIDPLPEDRDRIRENWALIGYEYWTTRDLVEMWQNPLTGHVAEMTTY